MAINESGMCPKGDNLKLKPAIIGSCALFC